MNSIGLKHTQMYEFCIHLLFTFEIYISLIIAELLKTIKFYSDKYSWFLLVMDSVFFN